MNLFFAGLGLFFLIYRLGFRNRKNSQERKPVSWPFVSIVIPARNEEKNLKSLLPSLLNLDYPKFEVIVVDDQSTDQTAFVARQFDIQVFNCPPKPAGWSGKNWACSQGATLAKGELLLFTDADTIHLPSSLQMTVQALLQSDAQLLTVPPFHDCPTWWEKLLGLFHLLPLLITAFRHQPRLHRLYSIGQYLLFTREAYLKVGGHQSVSTSIVEDMDLAQKVLQSGMKFEVFNSAGIYRVRMFDSFISFCQGWKRLFRLGLDRSHWRSHFELILVLSLFLGLGNFFFQNELHLEALILLLSGISFTAYRQRHFGEFSVWGAVLYPVSLSLFTGLSILAFTETVLQKPIAWRSRTYQLKTKAQK